jgi:hypothetical protein
VKVTATPHAPQPLILGAGGQATVKPSSASTAAVRSRIAKTQPNRRASGR